MALLHKNLRTVANRIKNGLANVVWIGDSTGNDTASPRWAQGIRRRWPVKWAGIFLAYDSQAPEDIGIVFANGAVPITRREPGATMSDSATTNPLAIPLGDEAFAADYPAFSVFLRHVLSNMQANGEAVPGGSPYAANWANGKTLVARYVLVVPNTPANGLDYCQFVTQTGGVDGTGVVDRPRTYSAGIRTLEQNCVAGNASTDEYEAHTRIFWGGVDETGNKHFQAGVKFYLPAETTGLHYQAISQAGWSATDHLSPLNSGGDAAYYNADGKYTQAQLIATLTAWNSPNIAFVQIGINRSVGEGGGGDAELTQHKTYVEKIALRYRAAMLSAGATNPQVVLVCHWQVADNTADNISWASGKNAKYQELIAAYPDWLAMVDIQAALLAQDGAFTAWSSTYLADTIHQTEAGVIRFAEILWDAFEDALRSGSQHHVALKIGIGI